MSFIFELVGSQQRFVRGSGHVPMDDVDLACIRPSRVCKLPRYVQRTKPSEDDASVVLSLGLQGA